MSLYGIKIMYNPRLHATNLTNISCCLLPFAILLTHFISDKIWRFYFYKYLKHFYIILFLSAMLLLW